MEKFNAISYMEFEDLVLYLGGLDGSETKEEKIYSIVKKLYGFFPTMDSTNALELNTLVNAIYLREEGAPDLFFEFKEKFPDLDFDPTGHSHPEINYFDWTHQTLALLLGAARGILEKNGKDTSKNKVNKQTIDAFELTPLKDIPNLTYPIQRMKYFKSANYLYYNKTEIGTLETQLEWLLGKEQSRKVLAKVLEYLMRKSKAENGTVFASHFQSRVNLAYNDTEKKYPETDTFINNLKKVIN